MKSLQIEFVRNRSWRLLSGSAGTVCLAVLGMAAWHSWQGGIARRELSEQTTSAIQLAQRLREQRQAPIDPRRPNAQLVAQLLQQVLNVMFATVVSVKEPGTGLRSHSFDASSNALHLEYELDSLARASSVTAALNAGRDIGPWQLENVSSTAGSVPAGVATLALSFVGSWLSRLDKL